MCIDCSHAAAVRTGSAVIIASEVIIQQDHLHIEDILFLSLSLSLVDAVVGAHQA